MIYPVVIHKDPRSSYGVTVPDLPGCFSAGDTLDDAVRNAREAIEMHLEGLIEDSQPVPEPTSMEQHQGNRDYRGGVWAAVPIDADNLRVKSVRVNITVPERVLDTVDRFAADHGKTRSGLLVEAVTSYIARSAERLRQPETRGAGKPRRRQR
ncbi:MAG TPA: type II toxin-antitoxin system HicB family antitoxin [Pirellulales bacterium]|jgi:predicted RNase H-like HicB family nuclease|nr:type II toxin-antitoxin system HicB family antitoxin [Pirellulales bacterium]